MSIGMISKYRRPSQRRMLTLAVVDTKRVSPQFVRVTLAGEDVQHLEQYGYDQNGRLFFRGPGQETVELPTTDRWMTHTMRVPASRRPRVRTYSIRRFRPADSAFDIEIAVHDNASGALAAPGSTWALTVERGQNVAFFDEGATYRPPSGMDWQLLVGDESALSPILAILEQLTGAVPTEVFLEVPSSDDIRHDVAAPDNTTIHWIARNDPEQRPGIAALAAVRGAAIPSGRFSAWTAGESALPTGIRRHLINDRGIAKTDITFSGYWRYGRPSLG